MDNECLSGKIIRVISSENAVCQSGAYRFFSRPVALLTSIVPPVDQLSSPELSSVDREHGLISHRTEQCTALISALSKPAKW